MRGSAAGRAPVGAAASARSDTSAAASSGSGGRQNTPHCGGPPTLRLHSVTPLGASCSTAGLSDEAQSTGAASRARQCGSDAASSAPKPPPCT